MDNKKVTVELTPPELLAIVESLKQSNYLGFHSGIASEFPSVIALHLHLIDKLSLLL